MNTRISAEPAEAIDLLKRGEIVALPTETVYGLAADALNAIAVAKIFEAKERPHFDPLIVHLPDRDSLGKIATVSEQDRQVVEVMIEKFWPGPLTLVLPKQPVVPDITTAGLDTVAVRMSAHPVFAEICQAVGPIAAPSANRFGRISPTMAEHVQAELNGRIPLIIDAGPTTHGIESTIVMVGNGRVEILRRGPITKEQIESVARGTGTGSLPVSHREHADATMKIVAPGQLPSHYAPNKRLILVDNAENFSPEGTQRYGLLAWQPAKTGDARGADPTKACSGVRRPFKVTAIRRLSPMQDLREAAANLFRYLRELDADPSVDVIIAERVPGQGIGAAVMDRLQRAAARPSDGRPPQQ